jgi:hypothetical protein
LPTRWLVGGPHFESLAAHSESPHDTDAAPPDTDDSHPASPSPAASEPPLSRQSLDRLLNDLTAAPGTGLRFG